MRDSAARITATCVPEMIAAETPLPVTAYSVCMPDCYEYDNLECEIGPVTETLLLLVPTVRIRRVPLRECSDTVELVFECELPPLPAGSYELSPFGEAVIPLTVGGETGPVVLHRGRSVDCRTSELCE